MGTTPNTVRGVLGAAAQYLEARGVDEARACCELLLGRLLRCPRLQLCLRGDTVLDEPKIEAMRRGVRRLASGEPVQYILGQVEFMGHTFKVDRRALIPRPDTELLVETALACEPLWSLPRPAVFDIGTGTGCIVASLALARPQGLYVGLDVSEEALALARENAAALGLSPKVVFSAEDLSGLVEPGSLDAIVSNPPYVRTADYERLPALIREHEPRIALDGGRTGLDVMESVVENAALALKPGGFLFVEMGHDQAGAVTSLFRDWGFRDPAVAKDLGGRDRVVWGVAGG